MTRRKLDLVEPPSDSGGDEVSTIFGDVVTFMMVLFILLFILSDNEKKKHDFFMQMQMELSGEAQVANESMSSDALLVSQLQNFIEKEDLEDQAQVLVDEQKITLVLHPPVLFDSGKAQIKKVGLDVLTRVSHIFKDVHNPIIVEGHTDNVPIHTKEFDSNWELSFHRAYSVVKHFIHKLEFSPEQLSALGYGEYRPIDTNDTEMGRAKNRRIEVNVIRITDPDSSF